MPAHHRDRRRALSVLLVLAGTLALVCAPAAVASDLAPPASAAVAAEPQLTVVSPADGAVVGGDEVPVTVLARGWFALTPPPLVHLLVGDEYRPFVDPRVERIGDTDDALLHSRLNAWITPAGTHDLRVATVGDVLPTSPPVRITVDNTKPTVAVAGLPQYSLVNGVTTVRVATTAVRDIESVELRLEDEVLARSTQAPYDMVIDTRLLWNGTIFLQPVVRDVAGLTTEAGLWPITVFNPQDVSELCSGAQPTAFGDVPRPSTHAAAIDCAVALELAAGRSSTSYAPTGTVTRAQMATFIARLVDGFGALPEHDGQDRFPDDDGSRHEDSIDRLAQLGIVSGLGDGSYGEGRPVTRDQMATFLVRAAEHVLGVELPWTAAYFTDVPYSNAHRTNVMRAAELGVTVGGPGGAYVPSETVSRGQMASFLVRTTAAVLERDAALAGQ